MKIYKIFIHCFIGSLVARFTLCPPFIAYKYGKFAGISLSGLVLSILFLNEISIGRTLYNDLNLTPNATKQEIDFMYNKIISKNPPNSIDFQKASQAYTILSKKDSREHYDKFGDLSNDDSTDSIVVNAIVLAVSFQIIFYSIGYIFSYSKYLQFSRQLFFIYNLIALSLILELRLITGETSLDDLYPFNSILKFQSVELIQSVFPSVFTMCCIISCLRFVDEENEILSMMKGSLLAEKVLINKISQLESIENSQKENSEGNSEQIVEDFKNLVETLNSTQKESLERLLKHISGSSYPNLPNKPLWKKPNAAYFVIILAIYYVWRFYSNN